MEEIGLKIRLWGEPILRKKTKPVRQITQYHRDILDGMVRLMQKASGIGLATSQVGINESMIVADVGLKVYKLINPKIIKKQGRQVMEEGCLSIPGICIKVKRARKVLVSALDEFAQPQDIEAEDLLACVLQHEIDHLKGKLILDYASFFEKLKISRILAELKKRSQNERLPEPKTKSHPLQL